MISASEVKKETTTKKKRKKNNNKPQSQTHKKDNVIKQQQQTTVTNTQKTLLREKLTIYCHSTRIPDNQQQQLQHIHQENITRHFFSLQQQTQERLVKTSTQLYPGITNSTDSFRLVFRLLIYTHTPQRITIHTLFTFIQSLAQT